MKACLPSLLAAAFAAVFFCADSSPAVSVRIASWNILSGLDSSSDRTNSMATRNDDWWQVVDALDRVQPDIVGFAELNNKDFSRLPELAAALGYPHYALSSEPMNSGEYRQGVMSKFEILSSSLVKENAADPDAREIKRWPIHAVVAVPGALNPLHVFVVHTHPGTATKQNALLRAMNAWRMRQYLDRMAADLPEDVEYVVMGDFNEDAYSGEVKWDSFDYAYYTNRLAAGAPFGDWFRLGADFPWAADAAATIPYRPYPTDRFGAMAPLADTFRTGLAPDLDRTTYPAVAGRTLDYILFSDEILQSAYGPPQCEVYWATNDLADGSAGLPKPGPWLPTLHLGSALTAAKSGLDHLMVFGDFHMIDAVAGLSPVAILSEVVHRPDAKTASYVEISNTGAGPLKIDGYTLEVHFDGSSTNGLSIPLSGAIPANSSVWIVPSAATASNRWSAVWDHAPDFVSYPLKDIDGNDAVVLKNASGNVIDVYGAIGIDGAGKPWHYASNSVARVPGVTEPVTVWSAAEWTFSPYADATPGRHDSISEADASVTALAYSPAAPAASAPFALSATVQPNALASNLDVAAHFSLNGSDWTARHAMSNAAPNVWTLSPVALSPAPEPGDLLSALVEVSFAGPGDLSPVYSAQFDYVFPGLTNASGKLRAPLFNEVSPAAGFLELAGPAALSLAGWSVEHWTIAETNAAPLWTNVFDSASALSDPGVRDEWGNPVGFAVLSADLSADTPAALVLRNPQGAVADAVAWLPPDAPDAPFLVPFLPDTVLSTNVAQGLANYLHLLGPAPASPSRSLQAPDWVLAGRATDALLNLTHWTNAPATSGALNAAQSSGALRLVRVDRDGDSLPDDADNCPAAPNPTQADVDVDGLGDDCDPDIDGDAIPNPIDNCPYSFNPEQEDADGDGVGDACDDDFDPASLPPSESLFLTFDAVTNGYNATYPSSFAEAGREWLCVTNAAAYSDVATHKIGAKAARFRPGGILALSGPLTNGLASVAFFAATRGDATNPAVFYFETSPDGADWTAFAAYDAATTPAFGPVVRFDGLDIPGPAHFRVRLDPSAPTNNANLDNLRLVSTVRAVADVDLAADLVVTHDGLAHTNDFVVTPAGTPYTVAYSNAGGDTADAPSAIGVWSAAVTVETTPALLGGTFSFPASLVIEEPVGTPEITPFISLSEATWALLSGTVVPNRSSPLPVLFEYGPTTRYGAKVAADESPVSGVAPVSVNATVSNLLPSTLYHWRILAGDEASPDQQFTTDDLPVPAPRVSGVSASEFLVEWPAVEGATNYLLEVHTLAASGGGQTIAETFSGWTYYYDYMAILGMRSSYHEQQTDDGIWSTTNASVLNTGAASAPGSKGYVALSAGGWLQTPPLDNVAEVAFAARTSNGSGALAIQVSEDGGATFAEAASVALSKTASWKTNAWPAALPAGAVLRFANAGTREIRLHDLRVVTSSASSAPVPGYPASVDPADSAAIVEGLAPGTTYYVSVVAQGPGWATDASEVVSVTTLAGDGATPAFAKWLFVPTVAVGQTLSNAVAASGSPAPFVWLDSWSAQGAASFDFDDAACTEVTTVGVLLYTPAPLDVGTQTFAFVAQNEYGAATNDFAVEVLPAPSTPAELFAAWLADRQLPPESFPADADPDQDGATTWREFLADTDPTDPASRFDLALATPALTPTTVVWTFPGSTARVYQLVTSTNLVDWVTNALAPDPATGEVSFTNSLLETLFSRLRATLPPPD